MEHETIRASADYATIAKRTLELTPFLSAVRNKSKSRYAKLANLILRNNKKQTIAPSTLFAANRKTFNSHSLSHAAIAAMPRGAYADAQIEYEGTLNDLSLEVYADRKRSKIAQALYLATKRSFDILVGLVGCICFAFLLPAVKIAYLITGDKAPLILKQKRLGQYGEEFDFYKIRTMVTGKNGSLEAQNLLEDLFREHPEMEEEYKKTKKLQNDPRVTKVGKFLRKTSLDEFAQFINILKGDISVVGNRPYLPTEKADMGFYRDDVLSTKCGLISYWAINGRNELDFHERLRLEQYYSKNQSLGLDLKIFLAAFKIVLCKKGAK